MNVNILLYKFGNNAILQIPDMTLTNKTNKLIISYNTNKLIDSTNIIKVKINEKNYDLNYIIKNDNIIIDLSSVLSEKILNIKSFNIIYNIN